MPPGLVRSIAEGRCVAFLGAGMSQPDAPDWPGLLRKLASLLPSTSPQAAAALSILDAKALNASDLEAVAQILRDAWLDEVSFERAVHGVLGAVVPKKTAERYRLLREIPFESILTTNLDNLLEGASPAASVYARLLRGHARSTRHRQFRGAAHVVKLHGDANGSAQENPVVLSRSDYRRRLYQDGRYSNFLRSVFATRTLLFLGVSFTDAYLNELRSEVLALVHPQHDHDEPLGYAVMADRPHAWCAFMRRHDGIEILPYEAVGDPEHRGFDVWLRAIHAETAAGPRVARLLTESARREGTTARIVWVDRNPQNNARDEVDALRKGGVEVVQLTDAAELDESRHGSAALLITSFDRGLSPSLFDDVMDRLHRFRARPPVVVFTSSRAVRERRGHCLRRGAYEACSDWGTLFDTLERLFAT